MKASAWVWVLCGVALFIAAGLAFAGNLFPAAVVLFLIGGGLVAYWNTP
ncbi:hypothetical protein GCM10022223_68740 [Kineosporia mesophila]|uniref:Uncharacterized protein n=1 Tax=Kineosporia mesophila TaxID=566012 RepID=A0ABP7ATP5_9ACTN|nr:hypothetical protein [Kineosporia mesophila]MCD5353164.1 hypothetical protein [Kineosporia mesophila]